MRKCLGIDCESAYTPKIVSQSSKTCMFKKTSLTQGKLTYRPRPQLRRADFVHGMVTEYLLPPSIWVCVCVCVFVWLVVCLFVHQCVRACARAWVCACACACGGGCGCGCVGVWVCGCVGVGVWVRVRVLARARALRARVRVVRGCVRAWVWRVHASVCVCARLLTRVRGAFVGYAVQRSKGTQRCL